MQPNTKRTGTVLYVRFLYPFKAARSRQPSRVNSGDSNVRQVSNALSTVSKTGLAIMRKSGHMTLSHMGVSLQVKKLMRGKDE